MLDAYEIAPQSKAKTVVKHITFIQNLKQVLEHKTGSTGRHLSVFTIHRVENQGP